MLPSTFHISVTGQQQSGHEQSQKMYDHLADGVASDMEEISAPFVASWRADF